MRLVGTIVVPGKPVPKGRARVVKARVSGRSYAYTPKRTMDAEMNVFAHALEAIPQGWATKGPVELYCRFFFGSNPRTEVEIWESDYTGTIPPEDTDNMVKLVADSLAPFFNDRQIVRLTAEKVGKDG